MAAGERSLQRHYQAAIGAPGYPDVTEAIARIHNSPTEIRKKLGVGPGSVLEWEERGDVVVVRRAARHSSVDIHAALFGSADRKSGKSVDVKEGIRRHMRSKHAGD